MHVAPGPWHVRFMTDEQARKAANVVLGVAAAGAACFILRNPPLRRMAWQIVRTALTGAVPVWLGAELQRAWTESARQPPMERQA